MAKSKYKAGDVVQLKAGGPKMVVSENLKPSSFGSEFEDNGREKYRCQWFAGKKLEQGVFPVESLVPAKEDEDGK